MEKKPSTNLKNDAAEKLFGMIVKVEKDSRNFAIAYCSANSIDAFQKASTKLSNYYSERGHNLWV